MLSCNETAIAFHGDPQELHEELSALAERLGGIVFGDPCGGSFSLELPLFGVIAGGYRVGRQTCWLRITHRPRLLPCGWIFAVIRCCLGRRRPRPSVPVDRTSIGR